MPQNFHATAVAIVYCVTVFAFNYLKTSTNISWFSTIGHGILLFGATVLALVIKINISSGVLFYFQITQVLTPCSLFVPLSQ